MYIWDEKIILFPQYALKKMRRLIAILLIFVTIPACKQQKTIVQYEGPIPLILVSKDPKAVFDTWLERASGNHHFKTLNMYDLKNTDSLKLMLRRSNGIIISGGEDVYPALYGKEYDTIRCGSFDRRRDSLEQLMIKFAIDNKVPLLAVCRGHQLLNVTMKGSLIVDIPEDVGSEHLHRDKRKAKRNKSTKVFHTVMIDQKSFLYGIVKTDKCKVYSNHHQAVDKIAKGFRGVSYAADGIIESIEPIDTLQHPFILGVQWHPEAVNPRNKLSGPIAERFLFKVYQHAGID